MQLCSVALARIGCVFCGDDRWASVLDCAAPQPIYNTCPYAKDGKPQDPSVEKPARVVLKLGRQPGEK